MKNQGGGAADASGWTDTVYLSSSGTLAGAISLGSFRHAAALAVGAEYTRNEQVMLPVQVSGPHFLLVSTDSGREVFERDAEVNNLGVASSPIDVTSADLVIDRVIAPATSDSGRPVLVEWTGRNAGRATARASWVDRIYLSTDNTLSANDAVLGELPHETLLGPGSHYQGRLQVTVPDGTDGVFYILVMADAGKQVPEVAAETNNVAASEALAVALSPFADLTVTQVSAAEHSDR